VREGLVTMTEKYAISTLENVMKSMIYPGWSLLSSLATTIVVSVLVSMINESISIWYRIILGIRKRIEWLLCCVWYQKVNFPRESKSDPELSQWSIERPWICLWLISKKSIYILC
jgi:hypothetical protein